MGLLLKPTGAEWGFSLLQTGTDSTRLGVMPEWLATLVISQEMQMFRVTRFA